jgi:GNAT superfamily N-acetyltransferase
MEIEIRALTPELADSFATYLGGLNFDHSPHWATCYCRFYHTDVSAEVWQGRSGEVNKAESLEAIHACEMKGYLAFDGDQCVGWCNANALASYKRMKPYWPMGEDPARIGATMCYVIHPEYRGQGLARKLLKRVVEDFKAAGFAAVCAYPFKSDENRQKEYRGTLNMYLELGFKELETRDGIHNLRLDF